MCSHLLFLLKKIGIKMYFPFFSQVTLSLPITVPRLEKSFLNNKGLVREKSLCLKFSSCLFKRLKSLDQISLFLSKRKLILLPIKVGSESGYSGIRK